jgi:hypothetical protein
MKFPIIALLCCFYAAPAALPAGFQTGGSPTHSKPRKAKRHKSKKHRTQ